MSAVEVVAEVLQQIWGKKDYATDGARLRARQVIGALEKAGFTIIAPLPPEQRAALIETATAAIRAESERIGQEVGWAADLDEAFATVAIDAVLDLAQSPNL